MKQLSRNHQVITLKDGRKLGFAEFGKENGKPIIYIPGWPSGRLMFRETYPAAEKLEVRIISVDRPGYGLSDYKENRTLLDFVDDIVELADNLHLEKIAIMGVSGGGPYAAACAYKIPERLSKVGIVVGLAPTYIKGNLEGLAFLNKLGWANYHRSKLFRAFSTWLSYFQNKHLPVLNSFGFAAIEDKKLITKELKKQMHQSFSEAFRQGIKGPSYDLDLYTKDWGFSLKDITVPVYLWYGEKDQNVGVVMGKYYHQQIPGSTLIIYPNEGHFCRMNHEEEILKTLIN